MRIAGLLGVCGAAVICLFVPVEDASADRERARVVHGGAAVERAEPGVREVQLRPRDTGARVIQREVVSEAATVRRELAEQPVHPHLVELRAGNQRTMVDPQRRHRDMRGGLDRGHSIVRAQQVHWEAQARPARVIRNERAGKRGASSVVPMMRIELPEGLELPEREREDGPMRPEREEVEPSLPEVEDVLPRDRGPIPNVPEPKRRDADELLMVYSHGR